MKITAGSLLKLAEILHQDNWTIAVIFCMTVAIIVMKELVTPIYEFAFLTNGMCQKETVHNMLLCFYNGLRIYTIVSLMEIISLFPYHFKSCQGPTSCTIELHKRHSFIHVIHWIDISLPTLVLA